MSRYAGRCLCGAVTWQSDAEALWAGYCHCESCRRAAPADFVSWIGLPRMSVKWSGDNLNVRETSAGVERGHCAACGTGMFYRNATLPDEIHLYAATLDDPNMYTPQAHYHWAERLPWTVFNDDLPRHSASAEASD